MEELPPGFLSLGLGHAPVPVAPAARAPPALLDEIIEEIFLRVPPDDPVRLLRTALSCKHWARLLADRGFRRRYRKRHGGPPPLLGFLANLIATGGLARFVPTLAFSPASGAGHSDDYRAHDARHGRVLLNRIMWGHRGVAQDDALAVWDPVTGEHRPLPLLQRPRQVRSWNATVLCAAPNCDHLVCRPGGHFLVVLVGIDADEMFAHVYSSESSSWGEAPAATSPELPGPHLDDALPGALARNALYLVLQASRMQPDRMVKYDLATRQLSLVPLPNRPYARRLMTMEDGALGFAEVDSQCTLKLWSMETGPDGVQGKWAVVRSMELGALLPDPALVAPPCVVAFADAAGGVIFLRTTDGLYTFDLRTGKSIRVMTDDDFYDIIPYVSFYTPVLRVASTGEGPGASASTA